MRDILQAAVELQSFCDDQGWRSCLIGGLAVIRWGEPRATRDVGISLLTGFGQEDEFITKLLLQFPARAGDVRQFAYAARILLLQSSSGVGLDIALAGFPFEEDCIARATDFQFATRCRIRTASAEDLVVMKSLANRPIDWQDVEGIVVRQSEHFDWDYTFQQVYALAEAFPESDANQRLQALRDAIRDRL
jgi:hypothetical protein